MSGLARLLLEQGKRVSGSDARASAITDHLERAGARIHVGHAADQVGEADLVIISAAVAAENPEVAAARTRGIPVLTHAEVLGLLVAAARGVAMPVHTARRRPLRSSAFSSSAPAAIRRFSRARRC